MFGFSLGEMMLLMAIALIAIGPQQLPEVARTLGKLINEFKRATGDFTRAFTDVRDDTQKKWSDPGTTSESRSGMNDSFTAGAMAYGNAVRTPPPGVTSTAPVQATESAQAAEPEQGHLFPVTHDDPFGSGHDASAHRNTEPVALTEEQLSFSLTPPEAPQKISTEQSGRSVFKLSDS